MSKPTSNNELIKLEAKAFEATEFLRIVANEKRLLILCQLLVKKEMSVTSLYEAVNLSQSALSQHLARMRVAGLIDFRRDSQQIFYRIRDEKIEQFIVGLKDIFCKL